MQGRLPLRRCSRKLLTSSILRAHISQVWRAAGSHKFGIYYEGGAPEIAWKILAKMAAEPRQGFIACDIKNRFGSVRRSDAVEEARRWYRSWERSSRTCGKEKTKCNQQLRHAASNSRPITVRDGLLQGACEAPVAFALALRVALTEFEDEMRKHGLVHDRTGIPGIP